MSETVHTSLRFGFICSGTILPRWQAECLRSLMSLDGVEPVIRISVGDGSADPTGQSKSRRARSSCGNGGGILKQTLWRVLARDVGAVAPLDLTDEFAHLPVMRLHPAANREAQRAADARELEEYRLDFVLDFDGDLVPDSEILGAPRYGVWSFQFGAWPKCGGSPAGFWEMYSGSRVTEVVLKRVSEDHGIFVNLRKGFIGTVDDSFQQNRDVVLQAGVLWPAQVCRDIRRGRASYVDGPAVSVERNGACCPTPAQLLAFSAIVLRNRIVRKFQEMFRSEQWNIGIVEQPIHQFLEGGPCSGVKWLPTPVRQRYFADPFGLASGSRLTVLAEDWDYRAGKGCVSAVEFDGEWGHPEQVMARPVHMSYPYLLQDGGDIYCIPETHQAREVALLKADSFPSQWRRVATLIRDFAAVDATVFQHNGRWWLLCTDFDADSLSTLHAWYSPRLLGPWRPHAGNPIKVDVRSSRPAGTPFVHNGSLYRPAQDCSDSYGAAIAINRIRRLTPDDFAEETVAVIEPERKGGFPSGLHTLASVENMTLVDGKRSVFVPEVFFDSLRAIARRLLRVRSVQGAVEQ